ncbi:MAG: hypothetical protein KatS3mg115_0255 [Candidatus Poribacteria bacterium]|nr:MAG: hypothetical protein KatS3mg115_0255 [Candidatus Poribacteria bacterium]
MRRIGISVAFAILSLAAWAQVQFSGLPPEDFVLILTFDEGKGETLVDHSRYGHDLNLVVGNAKWVDGKNGKAMEFDGATAFQTPKTDVLASFVDTISVGAWVKPIAMNSWTNLVEMDGTGNTEANHAWKVGFRDRQLVFTTYWVKDHFSTGTLNLDEWQHVAYVFDGAEARFYINGQLDSVDVGAGILETNVDAVSSLDIGWRKSSQASYLNAVVDELWVSMEAKSDQEIAQLAGGIVLSVDPQGKLTTTWGGLKSR